MGLRWWDWPQNQFLFLDIVNMMRRDAQTAIRGGDCLPSGGLSWLVISNPFLSQQWLWRVSVLSFGILDSRQVRYTYLVVSQINEYFLMQIKKR